MLATSRRQLAAIKPPSLATMPKHSKPQDQHCMPMLDRSCVDNAEFRVKVGGRWGNYARRARRDARCRGELTPVS
jgi:hypothetical protein